MTRTWILAYWAVGAFAVLRMNSQPAPPAPVCALRRVEYRIQVLGVEWVKSVRETPMGLGNCQTGRRADGQADGVAP